MNVRGDYFVADVLRFDRFRLETGYVPLSVATDDEDLDANASRPENRQAVEIRGEHIPKPTESFGILAAGIVRAVGNPRESGEKRFETDFFNPFVPVGQTRGIDRFERFVRRSGLDPNRLQSGVGFTDEVHSRERSFQVGEKVGGRRNFFFAGRKNIR
jgi:hypothetical protein